MRIRSKVRTGIENPELVLWEAVRLYHRRLRGKTGVSVMDEDWDNLVILDACRYDQFEQYSTLEGKLQSVVSKGSSTAEFLQANFVGGSFPETIYVSANPQFDRFELGANFHAIAKVWEEEWDREFATVQPEAVVRTAITFEERFPNKRLIIHFLQPHYPFIGDVGRSIEHRTVDSGSAPDVDDVDLTVWEQLARGEVSEEKVREAYDENLELVLPHVGRLTDDLTGKTIVTSDHGNAFGRWGVYGHPTGRYFRELVRVPWLEATFDDRKEIEAGTTGIHEKSSAELKQRLRDLGYV